MDWYQVLTFIGVPSLCALILGDIYVTIKVRTKKYKERKKKEEQENMREAMKEELKPLINDIGDIKQKINTLEDANCSTLRNDLLNSYRSCEAKGYRTTEDTQNWEHMYDSYKALDGNSFIDTLKTDFEELDTYEEYQFKKQKKEGK